MAPAMSADEVRAIANMELPLDHGRVLAAVKSLYADELKPVGRILRKRVAELAATVCQPTRGGITTQLLPNVDMSRLRELCVTNSELEVEFEEGGDWSVALVGRAPDFVDVYVPHDTYPPAMWEGAAVYFDGVAGTLAQHLPGGRYSCAQALIARNLPFLAGLSLGRVCHIVQLAISQKKVLGYLNGSVVPYKSSQSMMKERRAEQQLPCCLKPPMCDAEVLPFATLEAACAGVRAIVLDSASDAAGSCNGESAVPLSNVKRLFRSRYGLDLSETMLGHAKLSELLQDARFAHVCSVRLGSNGYLVVPPTTSSLGTARSLDATAPQAPLAAPPGLSPPSPTRRRAAPQQRAGRSLDCGCQGDAYGNAGTAQVGRGYDDHRIGGGPPGTFSLKPAMSGLGAQAPPPLCVAPWPLAACRSQLYASSLGADHLGASAFSAAFLLPSTGEHTLGGKLAGRQEAPRLPMLLGSRAGNIRGGAEADKAWARDGALAARLPPSFKGAAHERRSSAGQAPQWQKPLPR